MAKILESNTMFWNPAEPKLKNRFVMYIENIPTFMIKMAGRPSINFEPITMDHINLKRKLQGKGEWQDITVGLYDYVVPSAAQAAMEWVRLSHESLTGRRGYADWYKKDLTLSLLDPPGGVCEEWSIKGAFIVAANFQDLDWSSGAEVAMVELTLAYDYAVLLY